MRIVLGSDHLMFVDALADALAAHGFAVQSRGTCAQEVLTAVARYEPDVCLLGPGFSEASTLDLLRLIGMRHPATKVVLFTDSSEPAAVSAAIAGGAAGFITKEQHMPEVISTLVRVRKGERALGADQAEPQPRKPGSFGPGPSGPGSSGPGSSVAGSFWPGSPGPAGLPPRTLTFREFQVLMLMTEGESTKQIARSLAISLSTARTHVQSALVKLGAHSRLEASSIVARYGLSGEAGQYASGPSVKAVASG